MCLYNYNNKIHTSHIVSNEEYDLLKKIYRCIANNDNANAKIYTSKLLELQSSNEHINILNNALDDISNQ